MPRSSSPESPIASSGLRPSSAAIWLGTLLAVLACLPLIRVGSFDFVTLDDQLYVQGNPMVQRGVSLDGLSWAFTTFHATNWHPLTWLSHMLDAEILGVGPGGPHLVNLGLHAANTWILFACLSAATSTRWRSAAVAALFAVHPLHVESVAWISERKDVLSTFFELASMLAWIRWTRSKRPGVFGASVALFALALLAKPMPVTLPFVLLLMDAWPLDRGRTMGWRRLVAEKAPFFALSIASSIMTWLAQSRGATSTLFDVPLGERLANTVVSYGLYLAHAFWPVGLIGFYPHPAVEGREHAGWLVLVCATVLAAISLFAWRWRRSRPWFAWGWCWFLGTLVPVIGIAQVGQQALADRYAYVPLVGVCVASVWWSAELVARSSGARQQVAAAWVVVVLGLGITSWFQSAHWRNGITLFERCVEVMPDSALLWSSLGDAETQQGAGDRAIAAYRKALELDDGFPRATVGLGVALARQGQFAEALPLLERGVTLDPHDANAWYGLGAIRGNRGDHRGAARAFEEALECSPTDENALAGLCFARHALGDRAGAMEALHRLETWNPRKAADLRSMLSR